MSRNAWFETVAEAQRRAQKRLPPSVYKALLAGTEKGTSYADNTAAFAELGFAPHVADLSATRDLATTVMGQSISLPVLISPTGVQAVHPQGEVAVARAAAARGTVMSLSSFASKPLNEVVAANPQTFFQTYWMGTREDMVRRMDAARVAGAVGLIATMDWSFSHGRDWGSPVIPERMNLKAMMSFAPEGLKRPRWLRGFVRSGRIPDLTAPNLADPGQSAPTFFGAYGQWMGTPPATWADVAWMREQWGGPFMLKGIIRVDDARKAVDAGVTAISVSNHGGNNLDGTPAPIRALAAIADAVGSDVEIVLDSGIRRGSDVVKALALGARAVMLGRAYLWGLAANGQEGVENVLDIIRGGIDSTLYGLGHSSIHDLSPDDLVVAPGFHRVLGRFVNSLAGQAWPEVDPGSVLLIPIGSTEQHGPHLPLSTDTTIASAICQAVSSQLPATVAPALPYAASGEHQAFPGPCPIGTAALVTVIVELVRSASETWSHIVLVNGHGGNAQALDEACYLLRTEGRKVLAWSPSWHGDAHAGRTETSLYLALDSEQVRPERPVGNRESLRVLLPSLRAGGVRSVSPNGVLGDATGANADEGRELLTQLVQSCVDAVRGRDA